MGDIHRLDSEKNGLSFLAKSITAICLSLFFVFVYSSCNSISAERNDIGILYFQWESYIPLIPCLIVPYMSIDIFYFFAPFLCSDSRELEVFVKRIALGIVIAGACFLYIPLTLFKPRPEVPGLFGPIFRFLQGFDQPYNLLPSMHIILRTILAHKYFQKSKGALRWAVFVWFSLIGFSTLFTYQHHVVDVIAGFIVAIAVFYIIPGNISERLPVIRNFKVGLIYVGMTLITYSLAITFQGWWFLLLYPAVSTMIVASAYFGLGPRIMRKNNGKIPFSSKIVLFPYFLGQRLSRVYYLRKTNLYDYVTDDIIIGAVLRDSDAAALKDAGVAGVLDMTAEFSENSVFRELSYLNIQVMDLTEPPQSHLEEAARFIHSNLKHGKVYIHCKIGFSRSVAAVAAYLLGYKVAHSCDEAFEIIKKARPAVVIRPEIVRALKTYQENFDSEI